VNKSEGNKTHCICEMVEPCRIGRRDYRSHADNAWPTRLKLCGITNWEDAMQLGYWGKEGGSKFNGVRMYQNGSIPCGWWWIMQKFCRRPVKKWVQKCRKLRILHKITISTSDNTITCSKSENVSKFCIGVSYISFKHIHFVFQIFFY
jgi:hypothetical protein